MFQNCRNARKSWGKCKTGTRVDLQWGKQVEQFSRRYETNESEEEEQDFNP